MRWVVQGISPLRQNGAFRAADITDSLPGSNLQTADGLCAELDALYSSRKHRRRRLEQQISGRECNTHVMNRTVAGLPALTACISRWAATTRWPWDPLALVGTCRPRKRLSTDAPVSLTCGNSGAGEEPDDGYGRRAASFRFLIRTETRSSPAPPAPCSPPRIKNFQPPTRSQRAVSNLVSFAGVQRRPARTGFTVTCRSRTVADMAGRTAAGLESVWGQRSLNDCPRVTEWRTE
jgi:hypothetical protein